MNERTRKHLRDALNEAETLCTDLEELELGEFLDSFQLQRYTERSLEIVGGYLRRSYRDTPELGESNPSHTEWVQLGSFILYQYDELDPSVVWKAATAELPGLIIGLETILDL